MERGLFITFEGIDGCGKSTHARILAEQLESRGHEVVLVRDPGTVPIAEKIRLILLDPANGAMAPACETLLYEAARAQLVREAIEPALARGAVVISDRFFDSTTAYQGAGRELDPSFVAAANGLGSLGLAPDRTILLDVDVEEASGRVDDVPDRMELEGRRFRPAVRDGYFELARRDLDRVRVIDATLPEAEVSARVLAALDGLGLDLEGARP